MEFRFAVGRMLCVAGALRTELSVEEVVVVVDNWLF